MKLHRSRSKPDWEYIEPSERNLCQKIAARTNGVATPGNFVSSVGFFAVCLGLYEFSQGNKVIGAFEIAGGFLCDAIDGEVADRTGTKSPLGKGVDAGLDKAKIAATLYALYAVDVIPLVTVATVGAQNTANSVFTMLAMRRGQEMQAEEDGKKTMWAQCGGMAIVAFGGSIDHETISSTLDLTGNATAVLGTIYPGLSATISYAKSAFGPVTDVQAPEEPSASDI